LGSATPGNSVAGNGKVVFGGPADFGDIVVIGCDAEFNAGLTRSTGTLALGGNVTLGYEQVITLRGTDTLTLGAGKSIFVGAITNPVLTAGAANVAITPVATATLTAGSELPGDLDDPDTFVGNKTLTVGNAALTVTSGNLRVPGVLALNFANALTVLGSLTVEDGGIVAFANNASGSGYTVTIGDTLIAGVNNAESRLTASGGPVTLAPNTISGNGSTLAVVPDMGSPTITVDPTPAGSKILTIAGANLDLVGGGSLVINGFSSSASRVILASGQNPGKITLGEDTGNPKSNLGGKFLEAGTNDGTLGGNGVVYGDNEVLPTTVGYLSALEASNLTITGTTTTSSDVTIIAGVSVR
jgi:hypothetical protein